MPHWSDESDRSDWSDGGQTEDKKEIKPALSSTEKRGEMTALVVNPERLPVG